MPTPGHICAHPKAVVGRKLWLLYPPRTSDGERPYGCGWPPWHPDATETDKLEMGGVLDMLQSLYDGKTTSESNDADQYIRSCHDNSLTPLQWLVFQLPRIPAARRPLVFLVHPGQLLWIPHDWIHMTLNLDDALYVTQATCADEWAPKVGQSVSRLAAGANRVCRATG
eukprot:gene8622-7862_t